MKRILTVLSLALFTTLVSLAGNYTQIGYVKEKSSFFKKSKPVKNVRIRVKNRNADFLSDEQGAFKLDGLNQLYRFESIRFKDYMLIDEEELFTDHQISKVPLKIFVVSPNAFKEEMESYYNPMINEYLQKNKNLTRDLDKIKNDLRLKSERLAKVDFESLDEIDKKVRECLLNGYFDRADSLILSKGTKEQRMEYGHKVVKSIVNDFKILSENALLKNDIDKAVGYLEECINIDPQNSSVLLEISNIFMLYKADIEQAKEYINQALFFTKRTGTYTNIADCYLTLGLANIYERNFDESIKNIRNALSLYNVPNLPQINDGENIDSINVGKNSVFLKNDTINVLNAYDFAIIVYTTQGKFRMAMKIMDIKKQYSLNHFVEDKELESVLLDAITMARLNYDVGNWTTVIETSKSFVTDTDNSCSYYQIPFLFLSSLSYNQIGEPDSARVCLDKIDNFFSNDESRIYDQYYLGARTLRSTFLLNDEKFEEANSYIEDIRNTVDLEKSPYQDYVAILYSNLGIANIKMQHYDKGLNYLLFADSIASNMHKNGTPDNSQDVTICANIACAYSNNDDNEKALSYIYKSFSIAKKIYKEIGYEHPLFYQTIDIMFSIEFDAGRYKDAMETALWTFKVMDEDKGLRLEWIEKCYAQASKDKAFKKRKDFKEMKQLYDEYKKKNMNFKRILN